MYSRYLYFLKMRVENFSQFKMQYLQIKNNIFATISFNKYRFEIKSTFFLEFFHQDNKLQNYCSVQYKNLTLCFENFEINTKKTTNSLYRCRFLLLIM